MINGSNDAYWKLSRLEGVLPPRKLIGEQLFLLGLHPDLVILFITEKWSSSDIHWKDATFFLQLNDVQVLKFYSTLWKLFCRLFSGENPFRDKRRLLQSVTEHSSTEIHPPNKLVSKTDKKFVPGLISDYWTKYCWKIKRTLYPRFEWTSERAWAETSEAQRPDNVYQDAQILPCEENWKGATRDPSCRAEETFFWFREERRRDRKKIRSKAWRCCRTREKGRSYQGTCRTPDVTCAIALDKYTTPWRPTSFTTNVDVAVSSSYWYQPFWGITQTGKERAICEQVPLEWRENYVTIPALPSSTTSFGCSAWKR